MLWGPGEALASHLPVHLTSHGHHVSLSIGLTTSQLWGQGLTSLRKELPSQVSSVHVRFSTCSVTSFLSEVTCFNTQVQGISRDSSGDSPALESLLDSCKPETVQMGRQGVW